MHARSPIAILTSVHDPFDPRIFHKQARALAEAGYPVVLLAPHTESAVVHGVHVHGVTPTPTRLGRPLVWMRLLHRALRLRAAAYHFHDPELLPLGLLLSWLTGRPVIYDAHEYYREEIALRPWIPRPLRRIAAEAVHAVEGFAARRLAAVVAVNEHMAAGFQQRGARRVVAVHNYPRLSAFPTRQRETGDEQGGWADNERRTAGGETGGEAGCRPSLTPLSSPERSVLYVGLLNRERGLAVAWEAARRLQERAPGVRVEVIGRVDWGDAPAEVPRDPERWQAEAGTLLRGVIPADRVPAALSRAAIGWIPFQLTPNNARAIPLKLLEYMAAGLPVVASDMGMIAEIVRTAGCGLLVPPANADAHAEALAYLLTHPEEAQTMAEQGQRAVRERFTWEAEQHRLLHLYRQVLR